MLSGLLTLYCVYGNFFNNSGIPQVYLGSILMMCFKRNPLKVSK